MQEQVEAVGPGRILVADDSRLVRAFVQHHLRAAGYVVDEAANGAEALRRLKGGGYDVVITDLNMPEVDGFGVLSAVKGIAPGTEVIVLTGASDVTSAVRALRLGAHDYLTKPPSSADEVVLTVQRAVEKKRLLAANQHLLRELEKVSLTDALTGVANRRSFEKDLAQETARAHRHGHPLSFAILDLDHFKKVNDTHGHPAGDEVLRSVGRTLQRELRAGDALYRYGGEEFVVLLPDTDLAGAREATERLVRAVAGQPIRVGAADLRVTISAGLASLSAKDAGGLALLGRADAALYRAKALGRNRVEPARDLAEPGGKRVELRRRTRLALAG